MTTLSLDEDELELIARKFLWDKYQMPLDIPVKRNNRLRSTHGRFVTRNNRAYKIELAGYVLDYATKDIIIGILKHECIHYVLFSKNIAHRDGDPSFEKELMKHGAPKTGTSMIGKFFEYTCTRCGKTSHTRKKNVILHPNDYRTSCCNAHLSIVGEQIYNGTLKS